MRGHWVMFQEIAPANDGTPWGVGWLSAEDKTISRLSWYATEDEARVSHHRLLYGA